MVTDCLKGIHQEDFYDFLGEAVQDKMNGTLEACREYLRKQE